METTGQRPGTGRREGRVPLDVSQSISGAFDEVVAQTSEEDMQSLRKSIDATPEAASVLKAKGLSSSQVVAINIAGGVLAMFAKTA